MPDQNIGHSPEPWKYQGDDFYGYIVAADGDQVAGGQNYEGALGEDDPNVVRILSCVNACEGISNESLKRLKFLFVS